MTTKQKINLTFLVFALFLFKSTTGVGAATVCTGTTGGSYTTYDCVYVGGAQCQGTNHYSSSGCQWYPNTTSNCGGCVTQSQSCTVNGGTCDINGPNVGAGGCGGTAVWQMNGCNVCTSNCTGKVCGEAGGCGVTCPSTGFNTWSAWTCGACTYRTGCGNVNLYEDCTRDNLCNQTQNATNICGSECHECGARISGWSAWSACSSSSFQRTRDRSCAEDCGTDDCAGVNLNDTETCYGSVNGTFFDASLVDTCATYATQNKVSGATLTLTATVNHSTVYNSSTNTNGAYNRGNLLVPDTYNLAYTIPDTVRYIATPAKLLCDGALTGLSLTTQGQAITRRVGLWRVYGGWFQSQGGGVYGNGGITVTIPATCQLPANITTCNSYTSGTVKTPLIVADANGATGTAYAGDGYTVSLGGGSTAASNAVVSNTNHQAGSGYAERIQGYNFFMKQGSQYQNTDKTAWNGAEGKPSGSSNGLYKTNFTGTLNVGTPTQPGAGEQIVIFHDGDVNVTSDIDVPVGSFFGVIATGNIRVQPGVTRAEGVFIADQNFEVLSSGDENTEVRFVGEGSFVGLTGINLLRTRGVTNNTESTEFFIFRPDFTINAPFGLRLPQYTWREVAP